MKYYILNSRFWSEILDRSRPKFSSVWTLGTLLLVFYFALKSLYFALYTKIGVPPDELWHLHVIQFYYQAKGEFLSADPKYIPYGAISESFWLYHYSMAMSIHIKPDFISDIAWLRVLSSSLSISYLAIFVSLANKLLQKPLVFIAVVIQSNLLMFTFMAGSISYDVLTQLLAILTLNSWVKWIQNREWSSLLVSLVCIGLGSLTKITFLPFAFLVVLAGLADCFLSRNEIATKVRWQDLWNQKVKVCILAISTILSCQLVLGNYIQFGSVSPSCAQVYSQAECERGNPIVKRDKLFSENEAPVRLGVSDYLEKWMDAMLQRTFGIISGVKVWPKPTTIKTIKDSFIVLTISALLGISYSLIKKTFKEHYPILLLTFIGLGYATILAFFVNYRSYLNTGVFVLALQGRYLFPVISTLIITYCFYLFRPFPNKILLPIALVCAGFFIRNEFVYLLQHKEKHQIFSTQSLLHSK